MPQLFTLRVLAMSATLLSLLVASGGVGHAQQTSGATYQRSRSYWNGGIDAHTPTRRGSGKHYQKHNHYQQQPQQQYHHRRRGHAAPQVSGGSFQRPYPYHLDYYKMRWGGSYAPYFGNLYGPPDVVLGVPYGGVPFGGVPYGYGNGIYNGGPIAPGVAGPGVGVPYAAPPVVAP